MEYFDEFKRRYKNNNDLARLNMIFMKIKNKYNIKSQNELAKVLGVNKMYLSRVSRGLAKPSQVLFQSMCFVLGISARDFEQEYTNSTVDEYVNSDGHLVIDGVDYGKII